MFKVLNAYNGWSNVNYVLNDVKNPVRTLKISGPLGLGICAILYILANVAFFAYVVVPRLLWMTDIHHTYSTERQRKKKLKTQAPLLQLCFSGMFLGPKRRERSRLLLRWGDLISLNFSNWSLIQATSSAIGNVITVVSLRILSNEHANPNVHFRLKTYSASRVNQGIY